MRPEPIPVEHLTRAHLKRSYSRLVVGPFDHRFLVHIRRLKTSATTIMVHSVTAWEPGWVEVETMDQARKLILDYSTPRYPR